MADSMVHINKPEETFTINTDYFTIHVKNNDIGVSVDVTLRGTDQYLHEGTYYNDDYIEEEDE